jgi:hypothetical protein
MAKIAMALGCKLSVHLRPEDVQDAQIEAPEAPIKLSAVRFTNNIKRPKKMKH